MFKSKRFLLTFIGFFTFCLLAFLKHFYPGISESIIGMAAGLLSAYTGFETFRRSGGSHGESK